MDFRQNKNSKDPPFFINGSDVEQVNAFKMQGTFMTDNLLWNTSADEILKKGRQRLFFLRALNSYRVREIIIESILTTNIVVWFGRARQNGFRKLESVVRNAERIIGTGLPSLNSLYQERASKQIMLIPNQQLFQVPGFREKTWNF